MLFPDLVTQEGPASWILRAKRNFRVTRPKLSILQLWTQRPRKGMYCRKSHGPGVAKPGLPVQCLQILAQYLSHPAFVM